MSEIRKPDFERIESLIVQSGWVLPELLAPVKEEARVKDLCLLEHCVVQGLVNDEQALELLSKETGLVPVRVWKQKILKEVTELVPRETARQFGVIPLARVGQILTLACSDPWNQAMLEEVKESSRSSAVLPVLAAKTDLKEALDQHYGDNLEQALKEVIQKIEGPEMKLVEGGEPSEGMTDKSILLSMTDQEPIVRLTQNILAEGVQRRASDIFIEPQANRLVVRYRVDGLLQEGLTPPKSMQQGVLSRLKIMSNLDIAEQRLPQDGRIKIRTDNRWVEFRLSTIPSYYGEKACLRILDPGQMKLKLSGLGFDDDSMKKIEKASASSFGMILICGPTGSGKTTTLYSILKHVDGIERNLVTVEDPVEFHIDGINQVNVRTEVGLTFAASLRSILRQDPDVVLIGEIRDHETLDIGVKAALTGHLVLSTLHTNSAAGSITRLLNMGIEPFLITASVVMVGSQRLVRKLCDNCKEPYKLDDRQIASLGKMKSEGITWYKPKGCPECKMKGYLGRVSVMEILEITPAIKQLVCQRATEAEIKAQARKEGMVTLRENSIQKAQAGLTTLDEALRVSVRDD